MHNFLYTKFCRKIAKYNCNMVQIVFTVATILSIIIIVVLLIIKSISLRYNCIPYDYSLRFIRNILKHSFLRNAIDSATWKWKAGTNVLSCKFLGQHFVVLPTLWLSPVPGTRVPDTLVHGCYRYRTKLYRPDRARVASVINPSRCPLWRSTFLFVLLLLPGITPGTKCITGIIISMTGPP